MEEDILTILPQEIWIDILRRLPIKSVMRCKFVCKSWGDLIERDDFSRSYISKPYLAFGHVDMGYAVYDDTREPLFRFRLAQSGFTRNLSCVTIDSVNGLLLVWDKCHCHVSVLCLVNPITREYIDLCHLPEGKRIYGFGVSKLSRQYKILFGNQYMPRHIYTIGRKVGWRSVAQVVEPPRQSPEGDAKFLNGNLHWLASGSNLVCCFDLETEVFTNFSRPPQDDHGYGGRRYGGYRLFILEDSLCLCDISDNVHVFIWRMNNYGDVNSWVKEYTFDQQPYLGETARPKILNYVLILKVLENGDLLFTVNTDDQLFIYSRNTKTVEPCGFLPRMSLWYSSNITIYTPTFLSLKSMGIDNVGSSSFL